MSQVAVDTKISKNTRSQLKAVPTKSPVLSLYFGVHMGMGHTGLAELARKSRRHIDRLAVGEYLVFINRDKSAAKMYAAGNTIAHLKMPSGRLTIDILEIIPTLFGGGRIRYSATQRKEIEMALKQID